MRALVVGYLMDGRGTLRSNCEIFIKDGLVEAIFDASDGSAVASAVRRAFANAERIDLPESFAMPGLMNSHHHAYSALARGIPLRESLPDFKAILARLWWRLDSALDLETVKLSALVTALESARHGCTTIFDHHSSPNAIGGSLDVIADAFDVFHLSATLCYETTDRSGMRALEEAMEENLRFHKKTKRGARFRGMFGLHASFTLGDESLKKIARAKPAEMPVHVHAAEDECDARDARERGYAGPLARFEKFGLLGEHALIAHGVHLADAELELAERLGLRIALNAESNCNNRVGYSDPDRFPRDRALLGTDGMSSNLLASLRSAMLLYSAYGGGAQSSFELAEAMLFRNPARYATEVFGREMGVIEAGLPADFAVFPYAPPTPLAQENWMAHALYGIAPNAQASWVYANGKAIIEDGTCVVIDEHALMKEARSAAASLWKRFAKQTGSES